MMKSFFNKKQNQEEGLPEVAQMAAKKNPIVLVVIGLVLVVFFVIYFLSNKDKKTTQTTEDNFVVQQDAPKNQASSQEVKDAPQAKIDPVILQQQIAMIQERQEQQKELQMRLAAPLMVVNNGQANATPSTSAQAASSSRDPNTQFMNQVSNQSFDTSTATSLGSLHSIIAQGNLIHAVLESAVNSDLPGYLRAIVNQPCYSEDGSEILIPRGSRLIGQYKSGMLQGQSRIFVVWTRLITPAGISIALGSPGIDHLGVAGQGADEIDRHFWQRFGTATLLSIIGTGAANVGVSAGDQDNSASTYRTAVANSFAQSADQSLQQESQIVPTLKINQGKPIMVFVARDLHFEEAIKTTKPKINIF